MFKVLLVLLSFVFSASSFSQDIPTVSTWKAVFSEVQQHPMFSSLTVSFWSVDAELIGYSPLVVGRGVGQSDCLVLIAEGPNPIMDVILGMAPNPEVTPSFLATMAAHELGHCLRSRSKHLSPKMWSLIADSVPGSAEMHALEKQASMEEAYADAYALAYIQDSRPGVYSSVLGAMHELRHSSRFENPLYQVRPLYVELQSQGFDTSLPMEARVEKLIGKAAF